MLGPLVGKASRLLGKLDETAVLPACVQSAPMAGAMAHSCRWLGKSSVTMSLADKRRECWQVWGPGAMVVQTSTHPGTTKTEFELLILPRVPESCHGDRWQGIDVRGSFHGAD